MVMCKLGEKKMSNWNVVTNCIQLLISMTIFTHDALFGVSAKQWTRKRESGR